jgi:hypothetical protein
MTNTNAFMRSRLPGYRSQASIIRRISSAVNGNVGRIVTFGAFTAAAGFFASQSASTQNRKNER